MFDQYLKEGFKKTLELHRKEEAQRLLSKIKYRTKTELAAILGIKREYLHFILKGQRPISKNLLKKIESVIKSC